MADQVSLFQGQATVQPDAALALAVGATLDMDVPEACVSGIAANVRLLESHIATMRQEPGA